MIASVLGIPDPWIWLAYLLCLAATALCVIYAALHPHKPEFEPTPQDVAWVAHDKEVDEED